MRKSLIPLIFLLIIIQSINAQNTNPTMTYKDLTPNLMVSDIDKTIEFYTDVLNFNVLQTVPNEGKNVFAILQAGNIMLMFQEEENLKKEYPELTESSDKAGLTLYIHVTDIHKLHNTIRDKVKIVKDLYTTFYGSTDFAIEDCNGYILTFSQAK